MWNNAARPGRSGGLVAATALVLALLGPGLPAQAQENPSTAPTTADEPAQIRTPDSGASTTPATTGPVDAVTYYAAPQPMYATTSSRVRSGPGTDYDPVGTIPFAGEVSVLGESGNSAWLYVEMTDGSRGFTAARLLSTVRPTASSSGSGSSGSGGGATPSDPVCVGGQVQIQLGDGQSICAYLQ